MSFIEANQSRTLVWEYTIILSCRRCQPGPIEQFWKMLNGSYLSLAAQFRLSFGSSFLAYGVLVNESDSLAAD